MSTSSPQQFAAHLPKGTPPELITAIQDAIRGIFERHGLPAFAAPKEAAVLHEVGHAVVGKTLRKALAQVKEV